MKSNYLKKYIISSYILICMLIIFAAGSASLVFHVPPVIMWVVRSLIAWSPTYLLLLGWRHFRPDETRTAFVGTNKQPFQHGSVLQRVTHLALTVHGNGGTPIFALKWVCRTYTNVELPYCSYR